MAIRTKFIRLAFPVLGTAKIGIEIDANWFQLISISVHMCNMHVGDSDGIVSKWGTIWAGAPMCFVHF